MRPQSNLLRFFRRTLPAWGLLTLLSLSAPAQGQVRLWLADESRFANLDGFESNGVDYASAEGLAELLHLRTYFNPDNQKLVIYAGAHAIKITADNPFIQIDDRLLQMPLPAHESGDRLFVPLRLFLELAGSHLPGDWRYDSRGRELGLTRHRFNITGIDVERRENGHLVRLATAKTFERKDVEIALNRDWLNITVVGGTVDTLALASDQRNGIVRRISPFQYESAAQISLQLTGKIVDPQVFVHDNEVLVSLRDEVPAPVATPVPVKPQIDDRQKWLFDTIVIDPGHGGYQPGAIGFKRKVKEKDVNLDIALKLKRLVEQNLGVKVLMTREKDAYVGLEERGQFANRHGAKLFISIHCNSNPSAAARGFSVYVMGPGKTEEARRVAEAENSVAENLETIKEFESAAHILNVIAQSAYVKESMDLGRMMTERVRMGTKIPKLGNGVFTGPFIVLYKAAMPSVIVETAMLSNAYEEKLLNTGIERQKIAQALYEAIAEFKKKYEQGIDS